MFAHFVRKTPLKYYCNDLISIHPSNSVTFTLVKNIFVKILNRFDFLHVGDPKLRNLANLWSCKTESCRVALQV